MELYIRIKDGQPFEHPIMGDNFKQAFPDIDVNNLPTAFARFERVARPILGVYEVMVSETATYELIDGVYKDVWQKRNMTAEEKTAKQRRIKDFWVLRGQADNFTAWTFDEATCAYLPPIPRPETGDYFWQGTTSSWVETPQYPDDGKEYKLDFASATWVEVTQP